jgi:DNA-binding beta-propeller fold protein YncE
VALAGVAGAGAADAPLPLETVANVALPGGESRLDYASVDSRRHRLYIAHLGGGLVIVFDTRRRKVVTTVRASGAHGVLAVPELGRVFATATDSQELLTIDMRTNSVVGRASAGVYPDGIAYDPRERRVFVSDEAGGAVFVFDAGGKRVRRIGLAFGAAAGNVQYDAGGRRVLVNDQAHTTLVVVDPRKLRVVRRVRLPGCKGNHGLLVDSARRLAFVACDRNATLLTLDLKGMRPVGHAGIGDSPDVLAFDGGYRRLYVSSESGVISVFAEHGRTLAKVGQALLAPNAHVVAVDQATHLVYFPLERGPVLRIMRPDRPGRRP